MKFSAVARLVLALAVTASSELVQYSLTNDDDVGSVVNMCSKTGLPDETEGEFLPPNIWKVRGLGSKLFVNPYESPTGTVVMVPEKCRACLRRRGKEHSGWGMYKTKFVESKSLKDLAIQVMGNADFDGEFVTDVDTMEKPSADLACVLLYYPLNLTPHPRSRFMLYTVDSTKTLRQLALEVYDDEDAWKDIYSNNKGDTFSESTVLEGGETVFVNSFDGDLVMSTAQHNSVFESGSSSYETMRAAVSRQSRWPARQVIPYSLDSALPIQNVNWIREGLGDIMRDTCVRFREAKAYLTGRRCQSSTNLQNFNTMDACVQWCRGRTNCQACSMFGSGGRYGAKATCGRQVNQATNGRAGIWIKGGAQDRQEGGKIFFRNRPGQGCSASLGFVARSGNVVNNDHWCNAGVTIHEVGHAVGLWHEQSRNDRDRHVRILTQNIPADWIAQYNKRDTIDTVTPYDYRSIMHYPAGNRMAAIPDSSNTRLMGNRKALSRWDKVAFNWLLGYNGGCTSSSRDRASSSQMSDEEWGSDQKQACQDTHFECVGWANAGYCSSNIEQVNQADVGVIWKDFMGMECCESCVRLLQADVDVSTWPDVRVDCGHGLVHVDRFDEHGTCSQYCQQVGKTCDLAYENLGDRCNDFMLELDCDKATTFENKDAVCRCVDDTSISSPPEIDPTETRNEPSSSVRAVSVLSWSLIYVQLFWNL